MEIGVRFGIELVSAPRVSTASAPSSGRVGRSAAAAAAEGSQSHASKAKVGRARLISTGMSKTCFTDVQSGQSLRKEGQRKLSEAWSNLQERSRKPVRQVITLTFRSYNVCFLELVFLCLK